MTLDEVVAHLAAHDVVDGMVLMGSTGREALTPVSDYDLLVVLSHLPLPLRMVCTYIDHRLAEVVFTTVSVLERILTANAPHVAADSDEGTIISWLQTGHIAFDRTGRLRRAQAAVCAEDRLRLTSESEIYWAWFKINYNVKQTQRMLASTDPVYLMTVDVRLLYCLHEVLVNYFRVRRLPWHGDKEAIRYLTAHDPDCLKLFQQCLRETNRDRKVHLYERPAQLTLAPVGGLWSKWEISVQFRPEVEVEPGMITSALDFWENLLAT